MPRKKKVDAEVIETAATENVEAKPKRKPGRPRKAQPVEVVEEKAAEVQPVEEKATEEKPAEKKTAGRKKVKAEDKPAAKRTRKAADEEAAPAEKKTRRKTATKTTDDAEEKPAKTTRRTKKAEPEKVEEPVVVKKSVQHYQDVINWKKGEAHAMDWLYIEVNAGDLLNEVEEGVDNLENTVHAILNCMLEGDGFIIDPGENKIDPSLTVRYYCDNLSEFRRSYWEV